MNAPQTFLALLGLLLEPLWLPAVWAIDLLRLMLEPLPGAAIGLIGVSVVTVLSPWVLYAPA